MDGFTKAEVLVITIILGLLAIVPITNFHNSEASGRDMRRKADLRQIYNALDAYHTENNGYPLSSEKGGKIQSCTCQSEKPAACDWREETGGPREFCDENNFVYLKEMLGDPVGKPEYCYYSDGIVFRLYAKLEIASDFEAFPNRVTFKCNGIDYNYGVSSPNTSPMMN